MEIKFSEELCTVIDYSRDEAMRTGSYGMGVEHLMLGILRHKNNDACRALSGIGVDTDMLKESLDRLVFHENPVPYCDKGAVVPTKTAKGTLNLAGLEALRCNIHSVRASHLMLAICRNPQSAVSSLLYSQGADYDTIAGFMHEHGMLGERKAMKMPAAESMMGALGEQLTQLFSASRNMSNQLS